jgi:hypothetical protein
MDFEELKALIQKATENYEAQKKANQKLETEFKSLSDKHTELLGKFEKTSRRW